jgi:integration host factor subunit beta
VQAELPPAVLRGGVRSDYSVRSTRIVLRDEGSTLVEQKRLLREELKPELALPISQEKGAMTTHEFMREVSQQVPYLSPQQVEAVVKTVFAALTDALARGARIKLLYFGSFGVRQHRPRTARTPTTGAPLAIPAKTVPFFRAAKALRQRVQGQGRLVQGSEKTAPSGGLPQQN